MSKDQDEEKLTFKIITLGESGVGKTSILRRYVYNLYDDNSISTIGLSFVFKEITLKNKEKVQLKLIDTGGQEKYRALAKSYFKNADGVFFVYAIDNEDSFKNIKDWIELFNENHNGKEGIPQFLVESKNDLDRVVNKQKSEDFAKEKNLKLFSTSSKEDKSINQIFEEIAELIYQEYLKKGNLKQKHVQLKKNKTNRNPCCISRADVD